MIRSRAIAQKREKQPLEVEVCGRDSELVAAARRCLRACRLQAAGSGSLTLAILPSYLDDWLETLPETAPLALVSPYGPTHWLGPILVPGRTACYRCFAASLVENNYLPASTEPSDPARQRATLSRMAEWLHEWATGKRMAAGYLLELDAAMESRARHWVRRRAACPVCADRKERKRTDSRYLRSEITGICSPLSVRRLGPLWVVRSAQQIRHPHGPSPMVAGRRAPVLGRDFSRHDAIAGCMAEAIERYCLYRSGGEAIVRGSYRELGGQGIHPHRLLLFSERQYQEREALNRAGATPFWVPPRFDEDSTVEWVMADSLAGGPARLVPANYCFFGGRPAFCVASSNGCAAGRTMGEAILSGLLELIERDAVAIWWYNRIARPGPAIDWREMPEFSGLDYFLRSRHRVLRVFDITPDLGIPVAAAVTALSDGSQILMGAACDPDPAVAVRRAVTEACQMLVSMNRIGCVPLEDFPFGKDWLDTAVLDREPHLAESPAKLVPPARAPASTPAHGASLEICLEALQRAGLEAYYVDLTRAELDLRVVRVLVPELRYWVPRLAPGRLYDVPVRMGWLPERLPEDQLNRSPWFL